jgi:hypothetical protein
MKFFFSIIDEKILFVWNFSGVKVILFLIDCVILIGFSKLGFLFIRVIFGLRFVLMV